MKCYKNHPTNALFTAPREKVTFMSLFDNFYEDGYKEIAKLLQKNPASAKKYPKCMLCKENEGFLGTLTHPARGN
jgi:hypothetical protein